MLPRPAPIGTGRRKDSRRNVATSRESALVPCFRHRKAGAAPHCPIILPTTDSSVKIGFDALVDRLGIRPQIIAEVEDMAMMRLLARQDVGLAVLPPIVVKDELDSGILVEADRLPGITETFYAVTMGRKFPNPLLRPLLTRDLLI